ncbi:MAG: MMPL family transporter, partial [Proteobacteria bacterium]|nr:MMPL family transporter [Pseudomonadota bacterium]
MKRVLNYLSLYFETVPDTMRKVRWPVWIGFVVITAVMIWGIFGINFDMTMDSWFEEDDPTKVALNEFRNDFGSDEGIFIVFKPKNGDIFSDASLKAVHGIREEILSFRLRLKEGETSMLEHVTRVDTIVNASIFEAVGDSLVSKKFIGSDFPRNEAEREAVRKAALAQKGFPLIYLSKDARYGGIFMQTDLGAIPLDEEESSDDSAVGSDEEMAGEDEDEFEEADEEVSMEVDETAMVKQVKFKPVNMNEYLDLADALDEILLQKKYTDVLEYYPAGNPHMMKYFFGMMDEMGYLFMGMVVIIIVMLGYLFRSASAIAWPIVVVAASSVWAVGLSGLAGVTVSTMVSLTIMLILAVGTASSIHILSGYLLFRKKDLTHEEAIRAAFKKTALPCMLTCLTTMIGMLALTLTPITLIRVFGIMSALGVVLAFLFTIYLLPLMLDLWSPVPKKPATDGKSGSPSKLSAIGKYIPDFSKTLQKLLDGVLPVSQKYPVPIILLFMG